MANKSLTTRQKWCFVESLLRPLAAPGQTQVPRVKRKTPIMPPLRNAALNPHVERVHHCSCTGLISKHNHSGFSFQ